MVGKTGSGLPLRYALNLREGCGKTPLPVVALEQRDNSKLARGCSAGRRPVTGFFLLSKRLPFYH
jgi:hypothetical protein